jgi:hypothetical protein
MAFLFRVLNFAAPYGHLNARKIETADYRRVLTSLQNFIELPITLFYKNAIIGKLIVCGF